jgi:hypothetical protein
MTPCRRRALGKTAFALGVVAVVIIATAGFLIVVMNYSQLTAGGNNQTVSSAESTTQTYQPCPSANGGFPPGLSQITINGKTTCVVGSPIIVGNDGSVDFRNGTVVDLNANTTGSAFIGGDQYDTLVTSNGTRFVFNAQGVVATLYPYQGKEVFANGTTTTFPPCAYPVSTNPQQSGEAANGTAWFSSASGGVVRFYPNGTCGAANG